MRVCVQLLAVYDVRRREELGFTATSCVERRATCGVRRAARIQLLSQDRFPCCADVECGMPHSARRTLHAARCTQAQKYTQPHATRGALSIYLSLSRSLPLPLPLLLCFCLCLLLSFCLCLCFCFSFCLCLSVSLALSLCLFIGALDTALCRKGSRPEDLLAAEFAACSPAAADLHAPGGPGRGRRPRPGNA